MHRVGFTLAYGGMHWTLPLATADWNGARIACADLGGGLATPPDQSASIALGQWLADQSVVAAWIGLTTDYRPTIKEKWYWISTRQPPAYDGWNYREPSGDNYGICAQVYGYSVPASAIGRWNDVNCYFAMRYVCQFATSAVPSGLRPKRWC